MKSKQLLSGVAAVAMAVFLVGFAGNAIADGPKWDGLYFGADIGGALGIFDGVHQFPTSVSDPSAAYADDVGGLIGGAFVGFNHRSNDLVFGVEADAMFADIADVNPGGNVTAGSNTFTGIGDSIDLLASARGRLGFLPSEDVMIFGTAGVGWVEAEHTVYGSVSGSRSKASVNLDDVAPVIGAGIEWAPEGVFTFRAQGLYYFFDEKKSTGSFNVGSAQPEDFGKLDGVFSVRLGVSVSLSDLMSLRSP